MSDLTATLLAGKTYQFAVSGYTDLNGVAITTATVTINLYDQNDALVTTGAVSQLAAPNNNTYIANITMPTVTRITRYKIKVYSSQSGVVYEAVGDLWVEPY